MGLYLYVYKVLTVTLKKRIKLFIAFRQNLNLIRFEKKLVYARYIYGNFYPAKSAKVCYRPSKTALTVTHLPVT